LHLSEQRKKRRMSYRPGKEENRPPANGRRAIIISLPIGRRYSWSFKLGRSKFRPQTGGGGGVWQVRRLKRKKWPLFSGSKKSNSPFNLRGGEEKKGSVRLNPREGKKSRAWPGLNARNRIVCPVLRDKSQLPFQLFGKM